MRESSTTCPEMVAYDEAANNQTAGFVDAPVEVLKVPATGLKGVCPLAALGKVALPGPVVPPVAPPAVRTPSYLIE